MIRYITVPGPQTPKPWIFNTQKPDNLKAIHPTIRAKDNVKN